jgi:hypothetical protein
MMRRLKSLLDSTRAHNQPQLADKTIAEAWKFACFLAIRTLAVNRQTANETLRNSKNRFGPLGSLRTEIV